MDERRTDLCGHCCRRRRAALDTLVIDELPDPVAGPGQVVVAVKACSINYPDVLIIEDRYQFAARPFAPGSEISGVIDSVGEV